MQSGKPRLLLHSTPQVPRLMAPGDDGMRGCIIRLQLDRLAEQRQRFVCILGHRVKA